MKTAIIALSLLLVAGCEVVVVQARPDGADRGTQPHAVSVRGDDAARSGTARVALFHPVVSADLAQTIKQEKLEEMWRAEFTGDPRISLVSQRNVDKAQREEAKGRYVFYRIGDAARVHLVVRHKMATGYNRKARKVVKVPVLVMTAHVEWKVSKRSEKIVVEGSFFKNAELLKDLAARVKKLL